MSNALSFDELYKMKYDKEGDVLYITENQNEGAVSSKEDDVGIVWRYASDQKIIGITIQGFKEQWIDNTKVLAAKIIVRTCIFNPPEVDKLAMKLRNLLADAL